MILVLQIISCFLGLWFSSVLLVKVVRGHTIPVSGFVLWALVTTGVIFLWGK